MLLQHIVQVAILREFVLTDNLNYPGYTLVKLLADIHRFAASMNFLSSFDKMACFSIS